MRQHRCRIMASGAAPIFLAAVLAVGLLLVSSVASAQLPPPPIPVVPGLQATHDDFYVPPSPLPRGKPGHLIRSREIVAPLYPTATVTQIMYKSTTAKGNPVAVTGVVLVPKALAEADRPLVVLTPGTRGIADHCAASKQFALDQLDPRMADYETATTQQLLLRGFAVVLTDYEGNGTPGLSSYIVGRSEGYNGLDALRAAQRLRSTGLSEDGPVGIAGYSQGGQAAAWAAELQPKYAPELNLKGVLAGGVVTDVNTAIDHVNGNPTAGAGFALAVLSGYDHAYPELNLDERLTTKGKQVMRRVRKGACFYEYAATFGSTSSADITEPDVLTDPTWRARFAENLLGTKKPGAPAYLYHATLDQTIPFGLGQRLYYAWCRRGASVQFEPIPGLEHVSTIFAGPVRGLQWLSERLNGVETPEGCREVGLL